MKRIKTQIQKLNALKNDPYELQKILLLGNKEQTESDILERFKYFYTKDNYKYRDAHIVQTGQIVLDSSGHIIEKIKNYTETQRNNKRTQYIESLRVFSENLENLLRSKIAKNSKDIINDLLIVEKLVLLKNKVFNDFDFSEDNINKYSDEELLYLSTRLHDTLKNINIYTIKEIQSLALFKPVNYSGVIYFDPKSTEGPSFNALEGNEEEAVTRVISIFSRMIKNNDEIVQKINLRALENAVRVTKRLEGDKGNLLQVYYLLSNVDNKGKDIVGLLENTIKNNELKVFFEQQYFPSIGNYEDFIFNPYLATRKIRELLFEIIENPDLYRIFSPTKLNNTINFSSIIKYGDKLVVSTNVGASKRIENVLGQFFIHRIQEELYKRFNTMSQNKLVPIELYIDRASEFIDDSFGSLLGKQLSLTFTALIADNDYSAFKKDNRSQLHSTLLALIKDVYRFVNKNTTR